MKCRSIMGVTIVISGFCMSMYAGQPVRRLTAAERQERFLRQTGGTIVNLGVMKGNVTVLDAQKRTSGLRIKKQVAEMGQLFMCDFRYMPTERAPTLSTISDCLKSADANVLIVVVDDPFLPSLLTAPEDRWAFINVSRIAADNPAEDVLSNRIGKELWRTLGFLLTRDGFNDDSVMDPIQDSVALDALKYDSLMQEEVVRIKITLAAMGVMPWETATYKDAVEEGWAPPPTNDIQKAIWEKFHAEKERGPSHPITIQPPKTKK